MIKIALLIEIYSHLIRPYSCDNDLVCHQYFVIRLQANKGILFESVTALTHHINEIRIILPEPTVIEKDQIHLQQQ